jgi:ATP-binding cassette, subfamily B, bacterial PglK
MSLIAELWGVLTPRQRRSVLVMQLLSLAMAFGTTAGVAAIAPFFAVLGDPQVLERNTLLHSLYVRGGFSGTRSFTVALGMGFAAVTLLANLINFLGLLAMNRLSLRIGNELRTTLFAEYLSWPYATLTSTNSATLANNVIYETARVTFGVLENFFALVTNAVTAGLIVLSVLLLKPLMALVLLAVLGGGYALIYLVVRNRLLHLGQSQSRFAEEQAQVVAESFGASAEISLLRAQSFFRDRFRRASGAYLRAAAQSQVIAQIPRYVMECVAAAGLVGAVLVLIGREGGVGPRLGTLTFLGFAAYRLLPTLQQMFASIVRIRAERAALAMIGSHLRRARTARPAAVAAQRVHGGPAWTGRPERAIEVRSVSYRYAADRPWALQEVSLHIPVQHAVGIVGANGSGKSTLLHVIAGLLTPAMGGVEVDGRLLDEETRVPWQAHLAYVPQSTFLLDASIAENIALGIAPAQIERERLLEAARLACLEDFIATLPQGLEQRVGEHGVALSGGQRQRVAIARALYRDASVLLLDEPTNALDGLTEKELTGTLQRLRGHYTIVLIAHRMSTVRACDVIFQLEEGRIVARGTYDGLLQSSERFRRMAGIR